MKTFFLSLLLALTCAFNFSAALAAPTVTATQDDGTPAATRKLVGDTITYTTTISNTAAIGAGNDATGLMLTNPTPANTTDVGSVTISPIAFDDTYPQTVIPNIGINSANIPYSVFTNDSAGTPATSTIAAYDATSSQGGAVSMTTSGAGIGQFTYNPKAGFTGTDTFTYTISNSLGSSVGTVTINVAATPVIWFVNPSAGSNGTGTLASPFNNINAAVTAIGSNTGQRIFIFSGTATTGVPLKSNGWLIGQGVLGTNFDTVMGITPGSGANPRPAINGTRPTIGVTSGTGVTLADGNNVQGLNVTNTNGSGITGSAVGTLILADFDVTATNGSALSLTTSGTVTATGTNNNLTTTTGTALNVANVTIGGAGLTFKSISSNGGANGIILDTTGSSGGLTVTGTVGSVTRDNSGGTIQNKTGTDGTSSGHGIYLNSTANVSLNHMNILGNQGDGIHGNSVTGFTLTYTSMATNGTTTAQFGNFHGEGDVNFVTLSGAAIVDHNDFQSAFYNTFGVFNDVTAVSLNRIVMTSNSFGANNTTGGNAGVVFRAQAGTMNVTFGSSAATANTITGAGSNTFIMDLHGTVSADLIMKNNAISNNHPNIVTGGGGVSLQSGGAGDQVNFTFNVDSNTFSGSHGAGFFIGTGQVTNVNTFTGTFNNNTIGIQGTANSGSTTGNDLFIDNEGGITNINVTNNKLYQYNPNGTGALQLQVANDNGHEAHATCVVTGNTISNPGTNAPGAGQTFNGIQLNAGTAAGDTAKTNLTLFGNTVAGSGNAATGSADIRLRQRFSATIGLFGNGSNYAGTPNDTTAIANFAVAQNGGTGSAVSASPGGFFGTARFLLLAPGGVERLSAGDTSTSASNTLRRVSASPASVLRAAANVQDHPATADHAVSIANAPLAQSELDSIVTAARERWAATGLTSKQVATLRALRFEAADLPGLRLGEADGTQIRVASNAGGNGWFIGNDDAQFASKVSGARSYTDPRSAPAGRIDLLTTIMHEMGHALGLPDSYEAKDRDSIMYGYLTSGERRLPAKGQAIGAVPGSLGSSPHFLGSPVNIGTLPAGKTVKIQYSVTVGPISGNPQSVTSQGTVSGGNFSNVLTSDAVAGSGPTVTLLGIAPAFTSANATTFTVGTAGSFSVIANGAPAPTFSFTGTLPSGVTLSAAGVLSGTPAANTGGSYPITITASNGISPAAMQSFTLTVDQPPVIFSPNSITFTVGSSGAFQFATSGYPSSYTYTHSGDALPSGVTLTNFGLLSGTPAAGTGGVYNLTIQVSNGVAPNGTQNFTLTVNQAPAITSVNTTTFTAGTAGTFNVTATGFPSPAINLTSGTLPGGINFGTGTLAGTATAYGTFALTFTASNGVGSNAVQNFSLIVNPSASQVKSGGNIAPNGSGGYQVNFLGNPGTQYTIQFAPALPAAPAVPNWQTLTLQTADGSGMFSTLDNPPAGTTERFYRAIIP